MKKIVPLTAFIVLMGCSSDDWTPVAKNSNESYSSSSAIIESSSTLELSSSSVEPVIESSSETAVESSSSIVTVSSSSVETAVSSSSSSSLGSCSSYEANIEFYDEESCQKFANVNQYSCEWNELDNVCDCR